MNNQTTGFFIVVCLFVDRFRSTKTFFKTKHNSEKFPEVIKKRKLDHVICIVLKIKTLLQTVL